MLMLQVPEPEFGIAGLVARAYAKLHPKRTDWSPEAVPLTPNEMIPLDQGDDGSKPEAHG